MALLAGAAPGRAQIAEPEVGFEDLVLLTDREIQILLREVDRKDAVIALKGAGLEVSEKFLGNLSSRVREAIKYEIRFASLEQTEDAQYRIVEQARRLADQGLISWPPESEEVRGRTSSRIYWDEKALLLAEELKHTLRWPFAELSFAEIASAMRDAAKMARRLGILSLEEVIDDLEGGRGPGDELFFTGLRLVLDGTEPELIADMLGTRRETLLYLQRTRYRMIVKGIDAIQHGDNPCIIEHMLRNFFAPVEDRSPPLSACRKYAEMWVRSVREVEEDLEKRLGRPFVQLGLEEIAEVITAMGVLARREGIRRLERVADAIQYEHFLQSGLYLAVDGTPPEIVAEVLGARGEALMEEEEVRYRMIIEGIAAIQRGAHPDRIMEWLSALYIR